MRKWFILLIASLTIMHVEAVLPPLYQTASEINAIMVNKQLGQKLHSGELIINIEKNDRGYEITTNQHRLQVNIIYEPSARPGPAQFQLYFEDPKPLQ